MKQNKKQKSDKKDRAPLAVARIKSMSDEEFGRMMIEAGIKSMDIDQLRELYSSMQEIFSKSREAKGENEMNEEVTYRIYADGRVVHEDEFESVDHEQPYYDDYRVVSVPQEIVDYLMAEFT